jgi:hypothetical protein
MKRTYVCDFSHGRMSMATSTAPESLFVNALVCANVHYDDALNATSRTIINNLQLKTRQNGESTVLATFTNEDERVDAIEHYFGIKLDQEEIDGMKGRKVAVDNYVVGMPLPGF